MYYIYVYIISHENVRFGVVITPKLRWVSVATFLLIVEEVAEGLFGCNVTICDHMSFLIFLDLIAVFLFYAIIY